MDGWSLSFPDICLTVEENARKLIRLGIELGPARLEAMLPLNHSSGLNQKRNRQQSSDRILPRSAHTQTKNVPEQSLCNMQPDTTSTQV